MNQDNIRLGNDYWLENPFVVESPEKLESHEIVELFIPEYTEIETIKQKKHTFIWGARGAGKSMMLRYLEPKCQTIINQGTSFLEQKNSFLAIYCPCKEGNFNRSEFRLLDGYSKLIVSEHLINMNIGERVMECLKTQLPADFFDQSQIEIFAKDVIKLFNRAAIASSIEEVGGFTTLKGDPISWLQELFLLEIKKINQYLTDSARQEKGIVYEGATSGYHDFLLPFFKLIKRLNRLNQTSIYLMIDDAGKLIPEQQTIINTWIANRDQSILCLKISSLEDEYTSFFTRDRGLIEQPHDYSEVYVEELYTSRKDDYAKKVALIANRRLQLSSSPTKNIEEFLPTDGSEERLLEESRFELESEWEKNQGPGRKRDYLYRYTTPRLFQKLKATKQRKSYAGFYNMVHLSAGVIRDFLEPCYLMFDNLVGKGNAPSSITHISPGLQNEVLYKYSEDYLIGLDNLIKKVSPEDEKLLTILKVLINSLGKLFYERLHDPEAREARLFSFTVRGQIPPNIKRVLDIAVQYRYFQHRTYSTKEGGGREDWYILNRRFCPIFKLDPTGFEGRISITPKYLQMACETPDKFVKLRLKQKDEEELSAEEKSTRGTQGILFSLVEETDNE